MPMAECAQWIVKTPVMLVIAVSGLLSACSESQFTSGQGPRQAAQAVPALPEQPLTPDCVRELGPLNVVIAIDHTTSMEASIELVRNNVQQFVSSLTAIVPVGSDKGFPSVSVGLVSFGDQVERIETFSLTTEMNSILASLQSIGIRKDTSNVDGPEMGLAAAVQGLEMLAQSAIGVPSTSVLIIITDDYSHNGGPVQTRDFSLQSALRVMSGEHFNHLYVYDATPMVDPNTSFFYPHGAKAPYDAPAAQWQALRQGWADQRGGATLKGRSLGFPLQAATLTSALPQDLASAVRVCQ